MKNQKIFERTTRICGNFQTEDLFFWSSPFSFDPHSRIYINKVLVPPKNLFTPPQLRYSGAGPVIIAVGSQWAKLKLTLKDILLTTKQSCKRPNYFRPEPGPNLKIQA